MARKPNLLVEVAALALAVAQRELPDDSHPHSPHRYTQPQSMACLVLRACLKATYRQVVEVLETSDVLRRTPGLGRVPRHTTLEEFASRVASADLLDRSLASVPAVDGRPVTDVAGDSTGLAATGASAHYLARSGRAGGHYLKLSVVVACTLLLPVTMAFSRGPCNDLTEARTLLWRTAGRRRPTAAFFDRGYDAGRVHRFFRDGLGRASYIPPVVRTDDGSVRTPYRARRTRLPASYGRRWHAESSFSGLKRSTGSTLAARTDAARATEAGLRVLAYAIRRT